MTSNDAAALSRPYGRHAAPRGTGRAMRSTKGPGRHAAPGGRLPLAELAPVTVVEGPEPRALADRAPLAALLALVAVLVAFLAVTLPAVSGAVSIVERPAVERVADWTIDTATDEPAESCGDYCGTDAGHITAPAA